MEFLRTMHSRLIALVLALFAVCSPLVAAAQGASSAITGRILDTSNGLPIPAARIRLTKNGSQSGETTTDANGNFTLSSLAAGDYVVVISATGYQTVSSPISISESNVTVSFQTAIAPQRGNLREIATVQSASRATLQTSATINSNISPQVIQQENFVRAGDALGTLPFVTASTSSSQGDDESLSIRGFDPTETATLLDGHPIGPIGAFGGGYDYQLAQFWGLSNVSVIYGSGATGLYGTPTIAGAVNFETLNPTQAQHMELQEGYGDLGKSISGLTATGTMGRFGYALAYGVQGTDGELGPAPILQSGLLGSGADQCGPAAVTAGLPSIAPGDVSACTYTVSGAYLNRNALAKLSYNLGAHTHLLFDTYNNTMNADSSGNGDTDYFTPDYIKLTHPSGQNDKETLPSGATANCTNSYVVLTSASTYTCYTSDQFASHFSGPAGGGNVGRMHAGMLQDYHGRVTQDLGPGQLILDGFVDNYHFFNFKGYGSRYYNDDYLTHGGLVSYELAGKRNDASAGVYFQHQYHNTNSGAFDGPFVGYTLQNTIYYLRDTYNASDKWTIYADLGLNRSYNTATSNFDPRLSVQYRPTGNDVLRVAAGASTSEPDPALLYGGFSFGSVASFNGFSSCSQLASIGSGSTPTLQPEKAHDLEFSAAHRFKDQATLEVDAYDTVETNPILSGTFPLGVVPAGQLPDSSTLAQFVSKLQGDCGAITGQTYTTANLGVSTSFNAGQATYRGVNVSGKLPVVRNLEVNASYTAQSAFYSGIGVDILSNNTHLINDQQVLGIPGNQATIGLEYNNRASGFSSRIDDWYVGNNNSFNRPAYWYANGYVAQRVGPVTLNLGVYNIFNQSSSPYGLVGAGVYRPENQFGSGATTGLQQGSEEFGLAPRQFFFSLNIRT